MKLLVAIKTCHKLDYYIDDQTIDWLTSKNMRDYNQPARVKAIRETWLRADYFSQVHEDTEVDYKFFYGTNLRRLDVKPNQRPGTEGPAAPLRQPEHDEVFLPVGDNYTQNSRKLKAILEYAVARGYDHILVVDDDTFVYPELFNTEFRLYDYAGAATGAFHPGSCLFLSRNAMEAVINARITSYADDVWVGDVMREAGIPRHDITGIRHDFGMNYRVNPYAISKLAVALHSCTPDVMRTLWGRYVAALQTQQVEKQLPTLLPEIGVSAQTVEVPMSVVQSVAGTNSGSEGTA